MRPFRDVIAGLLGLLAAACSSSSRDPESEPVAPAPHARPADPHDAGELPAGVLAMRRGKFGPVVVDELAGMRRLVIDGQVQGAVPVGRNPGTLGPDPIVSLLEAIAPSAGTALVIGLGTGKTASDLAAAGLKVTVVEIEPAVIEYAKTYFGFAGQAIRDNGYHFLRTSDQRFDLVLMDAFRGMQAPYDLVTRRAIGLMRDRTSAAGVTIIRGYGEPRDHLFGRMERDMHQTGSARRSYVDLFGSGVGTEPQNLYLIASATPINLIAPTIPVWPVRLERESPAWAEPSLTNRNSRTVALVGYVVKLAENGALALEMPHWEMGAIRYLLVGDAAAALGKQLGTAAEFPTDGDIRSDGDSSRTLHDVLGGGGARRSDVRFSPLAALVVGTITLEAVVHPDASSAIPPSVRGDQPTDPRLPYGGALYRMQVDEVRWTLDRAGWEATRRSAAPILARVHKQLRRGELGAAAIELALYLEKIEPALLPQMPPRAEIEALIETLEEQADGLSGKLEALELAAACDRAAASTTRNRPASDAARSLAATLGDCAIARYEEAAADHRKAGSYPAARRLLYLYDQQLADPDETASERAAVQKKRARIARKYRDPTPSPQPPQSADDPPATPPE